MDGVLTINTAFNDAVAGVSQYSRYASERLGFNGEAAPLIMQGVTSQGLIVLSSLAYDAAARDGADPVESTFYNTAGTLALMGAITSSAPVVHRLTENIGAAKRSVLAGAFSSATGIAMVCVPRGFGQILSSSIARLGAINLGFEDTMKAARGAASYVVEALGCCSRHQAQRGDRPSVAEALPPSAAETSPPGALESAKADGAVAPSLPASRNLGAT